MHSFTVTSGPDPIDSINVSGIDPAVDSCSTHDIIRYSFWSIVVNVTLLASYRE